LAITVRGLFLFQEAHMKELACHLAANPTEIIYLNP